MATLSTVNVKITGDTGQLVSSLTVAEKRVTSFASKVTTMHTKEARGLSNLARGFTNAAGQTGVLNSEISILASSIGNIGLTTVAAGIGFGVLVGGIGKSIAASIGFEAAITKVAKTANFSAAETKAFGDEILSMSRRLPVATSSLAGIAVVAGQLGITGTSNIAKFVEEVAKLSSTTGVAADILATSLGTLVQVSGLPIAAVHNISAAITELGNTSNSTETQILEFSTRIVGVSAALGVPIADLLGISSAFAAAGVDAERGGTAIQRVLIAIDTAAQKGGDELQLFADVAGTTTAEFKKLVDTDPGIAFAKFVEGLKGVDNVIPVLDALGIADARLIAATLSVANSNASLSKSIYASRAAAMEGTATNNEFARSADTTAAKFQLFKNNIHATAIEIGDTFNPAVADALDGLNSLFADDGKIEHFKENVASAADAVKDAGDKTVDLKNKINELPTAPIDAMTDAFTRMGFKVSDLIGLIPGIGSAAIAARDLFNFATSDRSDGGYRGPFGSSPIPTPGAIGGSDRSDEVDFRNLLRMGTGFVPNAERTIPIPSGLGPKGGGSGPAALTVFGALGDGIISLTEALTLGLSDAEIVTLELAAAANKAGEADFRRRIELQTLAAVFPGLTAQEVQFRLGLAAIAEHLATTGESIEKFILDTSTSALNGFQSAFDAIFNKPTKEDAALQLQLDEAKRKLLLAPGASDAEKKRMQAVVDSIQALIDVRRNARDIQKDQAAIADKTLLTDQSQLAQSELLIAAIGTTSQQVADMGGAVFLQTMAQMGLTGRVLEATTAVANFTDVLHNSTATQQLSLADALVALAGLPDHGQSLLPSFASGIANVPRDMTARIHRGERIIPAGGEAGQTINFTSYITADSNASEESMRKLARMVREEAETALRKASFRGSYVTSGAYTPS